MLSLFSTFTIISCILRIRLLVSNLFSDLFLFQVWILSDDLDLVDRLQVFYPRNSKSVPGVFSPPLYAFTHTV
ncbi:hypothetical protein RchiOBHm_Chr1g0348181 [Rosa chinensis]|uniref:Uncharacterized protein n=1 Tax=Rosa chinensis TaxID=74649 RepID=A0A2P6SFG2_ROSCH|nr:hypothetical protein RchiOBHm_Chr1g0348181 [Rosa chinensis]